VDSNVDLASDERLGFGEAVRSLAALSNPEFGPIEIAARQSAHASYDRLGFEGAQVTAMVMTLGASLPHRETQVVQRTASIRFNRPYAVVAITVDSEPTEHGSRPETAHWHGIAAFSAWITRPVEPAATTE
jgi:hypothetical protein